MGNKNTRKITLSDKDKSDLIDSIFNDLLSKNDRKILLKHLCSNVVSYNYLKSEIASLSMHLDNADVDYSKYDEALDNLRLTISNEADSYINCQNLQNVLKTLENIDTGYATDKLQNMLKKRKWYKRFQKFILGGTTGIVALVILIILL